MNINYGGRQGQGAAAYGADPANPVPKPLNACLELPLVTEDGAKVFRCPSDRGGGQVQTTHFEHYGTSYKTNSMLIGQDRLYVSPAFGACEPVIEAINDRLPGLNELRTANPGRLILLGDFGWANSWHPGSCQRIEWHGAPFSHNMAFLDGHIEFIRIRKGLHVSPDYSVIPFEDLQAEALECQEEVACE